eukprot:gnl/MRDRNA2_/MRDRNA2_95203_c0_seq1.p1 gnl/MRDRNA2_/MRDRNA2_95203_c0~~gnl/MRDRNA2_/MRDRNA2_95203_c0_seq1.p1  ORF type:complete len:423 (+),score=97.94 gnl/MRDRNA2_/MRDRNA2_95203_c0_seq1:71-1339(+)
MAIGPASVEGRAVEVRKSPSSDIWLNASIVDIVPDGVRVRFEGDAINERSCRSKEVRLTPEERDDDDPEGNDFDPQEGDAVEVMLEQTLDSPGGWCLATVQAVRHRFYFVAMPREVASRVGSELIVERRQLRDPAENIPVNLKSLGKATFPLTAQSKTWVRTPEGSSCLRQVAEEAECLAVNLDETGDNVVLLGDARSVKRGKMLLDVHLRYQLKHQRLISKMETEDADGAADVQQLEFEVDRKQVGGIIGKGGENINRIKEKFKINVRIMDGENNDKSKIRVWGSDLEQCKSARMEMEFVHRDIDIEPQQFGWILGRNAENINNIRKASGLVYASLKEEESKLSLGGTRRAVEDAVVMVEAHLMYFPVFYNMDEQMAELQQELDDLEQQQGQEASVKGRGKSQGWGKGGSARKNDPDDYED